MVFSPVDESWFWCQRSEFIAAHTQAGHQADQKKDEEYEEKNFRNARGGGRDSEESEYARNNRDQEKYDGPVQHGSLLFIRVDGDFPQSTRDFARNRTELPTE